ncbi:MAG TPA: hypothetical protein VK454_08685, partial [Myxococcaceae bacterium]|nr:hypothetical protein [Myxococcaceae bacterium]
VAALVALPWFVGMAVVHGRPFLERFLLVEHLGKLTVPWTLSRAGLLVGSLGLFCLPWLPLVRWRPADASLRLLVLAWVGLVLGLFLVPGYKMQQYVVPALLPVLLLAACTPPRAGACRAVGVLLAVLALAAFAMLRLPFGGGTGAALVAEAVLLGLSAALLWRGRPDASAVVVAGAGVLAFAVLLPAVNPAEPGDAPWPDAGHVIYVYRDEPILLARLSGRQVRRVTHWDRILEEARPGDAVVMPAADVASLPPELSAALQPLASWPRLRSPVLAAGMWRALRTGELGPIQEPVALLSVRGRPER